MEGHLHRSWASQPRDERYVGNECSARQFSQVARLFNAFIKYLSWIRQNATEVVQSVDFVHPRTEEGGDQREEWGGG